MDDIESNFSIMNNFSCGIWNWSKGQMKFEEVHGWWVHGIASIICGLFGIIINVIMIIVMLNKEFRKIFFNNLIICLTISDLIFLILSVYESFRMHILNMNYCSFHGYIQLIVYPFRKITMCFSIYVTIILSFERYRAITNPFRHQNRHIGRDWLKRYCKYISPAIIMSFIFYGGPAFFAFKMYGYEKDNLDTMNAINTKQNLAEQEADIRYCLGPWLRLDKRYILWYGNVMNFVVTSAVPIALILAFNFKVYQALRAQNSSEHKEKLGRRYSTIGDKHFEGIQLLSQRRSEKLQSTVLLGIVIGFVTCHALRIVLNLEELIYLEELNQIEIMEEKYGVKCIGVQFWAMIANHWSHFLLQLNACVNFFVYGYLSKKFQRVINEQIFHCSSSNNQHFKKRDQISAKSTATIPLNDIKEEYNVSPERLL